MMFEEWFDIEFGSDEEYEYVARAAYLAGMERAAEIADSLSHDSTIAAIAIRGEINEQSD